MRVVSSAHNRTHNDVNADVYNTVLVPYAHTHRYTVWNVCYVHAPLHSDVSRRRSHKCSGITAEGSHYRLHFTYSAHAAMMTLHALNINAIQLLLLVCHIYVNHELLYDDDDDVHRCMIACLMMLPLVSAATSDVEKQQQQQQTSGISRAHALKSSCMQ